MQKLVDFLITNKLTIACYESVTGGLFGNQITNIPHASQVFLGGMIVYTNETKIHAGNINPHIIEHYGAISKQVAVEMSQQCKLKFNADISVSFTGNAGPDILDDKPIGKVYACIIIKDKHMMVYELDINPQLSRIEIKNRIVQKIQDKLLELLSLFIRSNK